MPRTEGRLLFYNNLRSGIPSLCLSLHYRSHEEHLGECEKRLGKGVNHRKQESLGDISAGCKV